MSMPLSDCAVAAGLRHTVSCFFYYLPHLLVACIQVEALCFPFLFFYYNSGSEVAVSLFFFFFSKHQRRMSGRSVCYVLALIHQWEWAQSIIVVDKFETELECWGGRRLDTIIITSVPA